MSTPFVQLHISLEHSGARLHSQALFGIRQLFPAAFRRAVGCLTGDSSCSGGPGCPCRTIFDQNLATDPSALRRYQKPPLPFTFRLPLLPEKTVKGSSVELSLVVVGDAISHLDHFLKGIALLFETPGRLDQWRAVRFEAAAGDGSRILIPSTGGCGEFANLPVLSFDELFSLNSSPCTRLTIDFLTPLRLLHKGAPLREPCFGVIAGGLFRRASSLAYYYGKEELAHDFKWLAERSREISCSRSGLKWVKHGNGVQGIEGSATFCGDLTDFIPFLQLGSRLNIGKGAAYGMGSFTFTVD